MNDREKKLFIGLVSVVSVVFVWQVVVPKVIQPVFSVSRDVEDAQRKLASLQDEQDEIEDGVRSQYDQYVLRTGGTNSSEFRDDVFECISAITKSSKLMQSSVNPKDPSIDRRSKIISLRISVSGKATFEQCIGFIGSFYEIPYIVRLVSLKLTPTHPGQKAAIHDEVKLDAEIEAIALPAKEGFGKPTGDRPGQLVKHKVRDLSRLRKWRPFTPYVEPDRPTPTPTAVATPRPTPTPKPPVEKGPPVDPDASDKLLKMVLRYGVDEVLIEQISDHDSYYVALGEELDCGELVLVHARGAVVHKGNDQKDYGHFVYPLGYTLDLCIPLLEADEWPEIQIAMEHHFADRREREKAQAQIESLRDLLIGEAASDVEESDDFVGPPVSAIRPQSSVEGGARSNLRKTTETSEPRPTSKPKVTKPRKTPRPVPGKRKNG